VSIDLLPDQYDLQGMQGESVDDTVTAVLNGGVANAQISFFTSQVPTGISMDPVTVPLQSGVAQNIILHFHVSDNPSVGPHQLIMVNFSTFGGKATGAFFRYISIPFPRQTAPGVAGRRWRNWAETAGIDPMIYHIGDITPQFTYEPTW
jgi:hypothetical protein